MRVPNSLTIGAELPKKTPTRREESLTTEGFADDGTMLKDFARLDLAQEVLTSKQTKPWQKGHTARMLFKKADSRIVLISLEKGSVQGLPQGASSRYLSFVRPTLSRTYHRESVRVLNCAQAGSVCAGQILLHQRSAVPSDLALLFGR